MSADFAPDSAPVRLDRDGYCIIRGLVPPNRIDAIDSSLDYAFATTPYCVGDFFGERTKRFGRLLIRAPATRQLVMHDAILRLAESILSPGCDRIALNLTQAVEIHPDALAQYPHRDHDLWLAIKGDQQFQVNVMWPLSPFIIESCPQRILLPNDRAIEPQSQAAYVRFGLNARQIELVSRATPKRQYYLQSAPGNRLFELGLGPIGLALCGASDPESQKRIDAILAEHGPDNFATHFLRATGPDWAPDLLADFPAAQPLEGE